MKRLKNTIIALVALFALLALASTGWAGLTVSNLERTNFGAKRAAIMDVAFDSSYAYGGESFGKALHGMRDVDMVIVNPINGYEFKYDFTNNKLQAWAKAPAVVYEEQHTISGGLITLDYPAAFIVNVAQANDNVPIAHGDADIGSGQCNFNATAGVRTPIAFDDSTGVVYVTYVTQAWAEVWANVVEETLTPASAGDSSINLTYNATLIQSLSNSTGTIFTLLDKDDTAATTEAGIDFSPAVGVTNATFYVDDSNTGAVIRYVKKPAAGYLFDNWVEEETATARGGAGGVYQELDYPVAVWGYAGQYPINSEATETIINMGGTLGAGEAYANWFATGGIGNGTTAFFTTSATAGTTATYIKGYPGNAPTVPLEAKSGTDLSGLTGVKVIVIGW